MIGILCGLRDEAMIAERIPGVKVACAAAVPQKARALAQRLVEQGATRLMSFGVAGALDANLSVGALAIGRKVISKSGAWSCDEKWAEVLLKHLPYAQSCDVYGSEVLVPAAVEKTALYKNTGCAIVDMESQCAAEVAAAAGLPLGVLRVVCDEANHNVPPLVMAAINPDGSTNYRRVFEGLLKTPREVLDLVKVGFNMAKALRMLEKAVKQLGS